MYRGIDSKDYGVTLIMMNLVTTRGQNPNVFLIFYTKYFLFIESSPSQMVRVKDLQKCPKALLPTELDKAHLEEYISDTEFRRTFGISRDEYGTFSEWRQQEVKKEMGLF